MENQLIKTIQESGLDKTKAQVLLDNFSNYFEIAADWKNKANMLVITNTEQRAEMKMAREGRLFLREKRIAVEKTRKSLKENALREGQTIDAIAKILTNLILPIEEDLEAKEKYAEIQEAKIKAELKASREIELQPYIEFVPYGLDFANMSEDNYLKILDGAKLQQQAKVELEAKIEAERIAREKAEAEERVRIIKENEKLKVENEAKEKQLAEERAKAEVERLRAEENAKKEREEAERKLNAEREAARIESEKQLAEKQKIEAELKAKKDEEERLIRQKQEQETRQKNASDKEKLLAFANKIKSIEVPELQSEELLSVLNSAKIHLDKIILFITEKTNSL